MKSTSQEYRELQHSIGMTVTLISFGMMFASLFLGYFLVRFNSPVWPPVEIAQLPKLLPLLSTVVIGLSSLTYYWFEMKKRSSKWLVLTLVLGLLFLGLQWSLWAKMKEVGILVSHGMVPSMVYAFSWLHAGHIVLGLFFLSWLLLRKMDQDLWVKNVGKFWHFLGIIWLMMYLMLFVQ